MIRLVTSLALLALLAACNEVHPGTPGHEPPSAGDYNPVSRTLSNGGG